MNLKEIHKSKAVQWIIFGLIVFVLVLIIFQAGVFVGYNKARFGVRFGDNFNRNFVDPRGGGFDRGFDDRKFLISGHGAVGEIVSIVMPQIVVAGPDNFEKTVLVGNDTLVRQFRDEVATTSLKVGDYIVVLGTPNDNGQIEAKLIRTVPPPPERLMIKKSIK